MDRPQPLRVAYLSHCHTADNQLKNQKFTQSFHLIAASDELMQAGQLADHLLPPKAGPAYTESSLQAS
jgi:hypothetical protein